MMIPFLIVCLSLMIFLMYCVYRFFVQSFDFPYQKQVFLLISFLVALLFVIRFSFRFYLIEQDILYDGILYLCSYALTLYVLLFVIYWILRVLPCRKKPVNHRRWFLITLIVSLMISSYGLWNAVQTQEKEYSIVVSGLEMDRDILLVSDLHVSTSVKRKQMKQLLKEAEDQQVDMIWIAGDLFDESTRKKDMQDFCALTRSSSIPVYYALGNHEQLSSHKDMFVEMLKESNVHVLQDEAIIVDQLQLVGRNDKMEGRKALSDILVDDTLPTIVMDHRPEYEQGEIDLQVSGHTHNGQIFPNQIFTAIAYPQLYGFYESSYPMIVTSGYGTWGFPLRIGSHGEYVILHLRSEEDDPVKAQ